MLFFSGETCTNSSEDLLHAAEEGNLTAVKFILHNCNDTDINTEDGNYYDFTPLIWASIYGHSEIVGLLLQHPQISINKRSSLGNKGALYYASGGGYSEVVRLLLQHPQINVNIVNKHGETALYWPSSWGYSEIVMLLLQHPQIDVNKETDDGQTALGIASEQGHLDVSELLLDHIEIDVLKGLNMANKDDDDEYDEVGRLIFGNDVLTKNEEFFVHAIIGNLTEVQKQLEDSYRTIDINFCDKRGMTALHWASKYGYLEIVRSLINTPEINVNRERKNERATALMLASYNGHSEVVCILLNHSNINIHKRTKPKGDNPLMMASFQGHEEVMSQLIRTNRIDINDVNSNGESSLYKASQYGHLEVVAMLLRHPEINVNSATVNRVTPLMISCQEGHTNVAKSLLAHPKIVANFATFSGKTALFFAVPVTKYGNHEMPRELVELLLQCPSIDEHHRDEDGNDAPFYAGIVGLRNLTYSFETKALALLRKHGHTCCSDRVNDGLQIAAGKGDIFMVEAFLLCPQVNLNDGYKYGITPLYKAADKNVTDVVNILLDDPRTDVNVEVNSGNALYIASEKGNIQIVKLLLCHYDIDVNKVNKINEMSSLMTAIERGHGNIVKILLHHPQTDVNIIDAKEESALSIASKRGFLTFVKLLLRCPKTNLTNLYMRDNDYHGPNMLEVLKYRSELIKLQSSCCLNVGKSLLNAALIGDFRGVRGLLICPDVDVNIIDKKGRTPLYLASWLRHIKVIEVLLSDKNINSNIGNHIDGGTPFSIASKKGHFEIMEKLINHRQTQEGIGWSIDIWTSYFMKSKLDTGTTKDSATVVTPGVG